MTRSSRPTLAGEGAGAGAGGAVAVAARAAGRGVTTAAVELVEGRTAVGLALGSAAVVLVPGAAVVELVTGAAGAGASRVTDEALLLAAAPVPLDAALGAGPAGPGPDVAAGRVGTARLFPRERPAWC